MGSLVEVIIVLVLITLVIGVYRLIHHMSLYENNVEIYSDEYKSKLADQIYNCTLNYDNDLNEFEFKTLNYQSNNTNI